ncbi:hypothetical protein VDG1235_4007 [Verrucomicrobiia bacterium DG1235]|nr:hypothetical protein VDG1235_4007 [Verrucomicrobiae bacterium DG1235]
MTSPIQNRSDLSHPRLQRYLYPVAKRIRQTDLLRQRIKFMLGALAIASIIALFSFLYPPAADFSLIAIALFISGFLIYFWKSESRHTLDYLAAARAIEAEHPALNQALVTAVEQELQGEQNFFSQHVTEQAIASESRTLWYQAGKAESLIARLKYLGTLFALLNVLFINFLATKNAGSIEEQERIALATETKLSVEPGDLEVERGSSIVVTARFEGALPEGAQLEVLQDNGETNSFEMAQSLSDPVFAYSLQRIQTGLCYRISYDDTSSPDYRVQVYDLPELLQADADLVFPTYTNWQNRTIEDTLRISAIEGTRLDYSFNANKPISSAYLLDERGHRIDLETNNQQRTQFTFSDTLTEKQNYTLHLVDDASRQNPYPPELRIDTIPNQRPTLRFSSPRGDQRLSPIEEVTFTGTASDDFGLLDYGIGFVIASQPKTEISLTENAPEARNLKAEISHLLALEDFEIEAKDSISWYLWADDFGPDGKLRRSTGDLFFADIRSLDEIFREQDQGGGGQGGPSEQGIELIEKQRRIVISVFRIKNTATRAENVVDDIDIVQRSQVEALNELQQLIPELNEPSARQAAIEAQRFMEGVDLGLTNAVDEPSLQPLELAWSDAQKAYQELVKLSEDEFNVSRSQNQSAGSGGGTSRNQAQLNELDFRQEESRYETASEAQPLSSPEERQNLELISKLNELSRRQDDMNERLQDMQTALAEVESEEERERIEHELKRLQEEQRQLMADADQAIQQAGNRESARQARQQLEEVRDNMQRATEQLEQGEVSQALASGTRAQDTLEQTREQMREQNSSEFSEAMRQARYQARELAEQQRDLESELQQFEQSFQRSLDDSEEREALAEKIDQQADQLDEFLEEVRQIAEGSENVEPGLFRQLYQVLRDSNGSQFDERYENSAQFLRQGFLREAQDGQQGIAEDLELLSEAIADAAESILGDETSTMEFAQSELDSLSQQLQEERESNTQPGNNRGSSDGQGSQPQASSIEEMIRDALADIAESGNGPITGGSFNDWIDRLSTVESLIDEPLARARISEARETAESMRRDFKRQGAVPQWEIVEDEVAAPLNDVRAWLATELNRIENPDALQPVDRDPIPEEYDAFVRRYYESLGED